MTERTQAERAQIAMIILDQMGGMRRIKLMTGARGFLVLEDGVQFDFSGSRVANKVQVRLNWKDLYDVTFYRMGKLECPKVAEETDLYAEMLIGTFERTTGLYLSLGTLGRTA